METDDKFSALPQVNEAADEALNSLPPKSRKIYEKAYDEFSKWCQTTNIINYKESDLLTYFTEKSKRFKCSTLWSHYSMLKATMASKDNVDIGKFSNVLSFLKIQAKGYKPTQSKVLTREQIDKFLIEAPDDTYLMAKVLLIFGVAGALRREELANLSISDLHDLGSAILVTVKNLKPNDNKVFTIVNITENIVDCIGLCRKYISLRDSIKEHDRLFVNYKTGKCLSQPLGKNMFGKIPKKIASFLKLPDASLYTGHCFRNSSTSLLKRCRGSKNMTSVFNGKLGDILTNRRKLIESEQRFLPFDTNDDVSNESSDQTFFQLDIPEEIRIKREMETNDDDLDEFSNSRTTDEEDSLLPPQLLIAKMNEEEDPLFTPANKQLLEPVNNQNLVSRNEGEPRVTDEIKNIVSEDLILINDISSNAIVFSSCTNITALCNVKKIYIGRSLSSGFAELVTFNGIENNRHIPLLYCLIHRKDDNLYYLLLKQITELSSKKYNKIFEPKEIKLDCDKNLLNAVLKVWPKVKILVSHLQLHEMWLRKIREFELEEEYSDEISKIGLWLKWTFNLTKVTVKQFNSGLVQEIKSSIPNDERVAKYADYLLKTFVNEDSDFPPVLWAKK